MKSTTAGRRRWIVALVAMGLVGGISAFGGTAHAGGRESAAPRECPPGFSPARPPLNPALGCLPDNFTLPTPPDFGPPNPGQCPPGFSPARPPLNPALGCLPDFLTAPSSGR